MKKDKLSKVTIYLALIVFAVLMLFPFYWMFVSSFKTGAEIAKRPPSLIPAEFTYENYIQVIKTVPIVRYFFNSLFVAFMSVVTVLYTTITGAFALSKLKLPFKNLILGAFLALMMVPYEVLTITNYRTIVNMKLNDNILALFLPFMSSIFYMLLLKNHFDTISDSLYYSVLVDGGSDLRYLWKVLIPSSKPVLVSISLFTFVSSWNSFMWPLMVVKSQDNRTITFGIYAFISEGGEHFELMMALSVIVILPMIIVFLTMRKYLVKGVMLGGSKG